VRASTHKYLAKHLNGVSLESGERLDGVSLEPVECQLGGCRSIWQNALNRVSLVVRRIIKQQRQTKQRKSQVNRRSR
jgi:hypothetical protein